MAQKATLQQHLCFGHRRGALGCLLLQKLCFVPTMRNASEPAYGAALLVTSLKLALVCVCVSIILHLRGKPRPGGGQGQVGWGPGQPGLVLNEEVVSPPCGRGSWSLMILSNPSHSMILGCGTDLQVQDKVVAAGW